MFEYDCYYQGDIKFNTRHKVFYLPHQCEEWCIGTKEDALDLINELKALIEGGTHEQRTSDRLGT